MKITYSSEKINSFGGINFIDRTINNAGIYSYIDQSLGQRGSKATYRYSDLFRSYHLLDNFVYRAIMTNDREMSDLEVVEFYNDRGDSERLFDDYLLFELISYPV
ncbi:MAG: hypothetical protein ACK5HT_10380 [Draconibacterium sp.]